LPHLPRKRKATILLVASFQREKLGKRGSALRRSDYFLPKAPLAFSTRVLNAAVSVTARFAKTVRSLWMFSVFRPFISSEYLRPAARAAALIRTIHRLRNVRFLARRSRYAYCKLFWST